MDTRRLLNVRINDNKVMKQKKEEIQFEPINKLAKSVYGTKVAINLDEEKLQSVKEGKYVLEQF